ncbi:hypothetical protein bsdtb5_41990 [Anaeromicropila herbilytica]|uniref:Uncharacterized protein n=1 Tax=Anaeromicropila herbilytica TaxID=2785025 RepID=A0A7R7EPZ9_9FIRM|nr:hypothetical protein bsdtb5_41990 [Anaeromicropila herbilytica]
MICLEEPRFIQKATSFTLVDKLRDECETLQNNKNSDLDRALSCPVSGLFFYQGSVFLSIFRPEHV